VCGRDEQLFQGLDHCADEPGVRREGLRRHEDETGVRAADRAVLGVQADEVLDVQRDERPAAAART
jgi:hypothetical protein